jgi:flagellar motility protein MotE (MotC chaperone)
MTETQRLIAELRSFAAGLDTRDPYGPDELLMQAAAALEESEAAREQWEREVERLQDAYADQRNHTVPALEERLRSATRTLQAIADLPVTGHSQGFNKHSSIARVALESLGDATATRGEECTS